MKVKVTLSREYDGDFDETIEEMRQDGCSEEFILDEIESLIAENTDFLSEVKWDITIED